jgi:UDP-glucose 4-epimerase
VNDANTILVTGGAGFIGSWVVEELLRRSDTPRLVILDNLFNGRREFMPASPRVVLEHVDLRDGGRVSEIVSKYAPRIVVHLAALHFIPYCNEHPAQTVAVNVLGTQHLLDACVACPPKMLVAASSAAVYPISDEPCGEDGPVGPTDIYGLSKATNEQQLQLFAQRVPTRCIAARFFNAIGPRETNPHLLPAILEQIKAGQRELSLGNVDPKRDYIHAADIARAVADLAEKSTASFRAYNVGTGNEYSVREIVECLSSIVGRSLTIKSDPARVRKSDRMHLVADLTRIRREIGWQPRIGLEDGLRALWESECGK